MSAGNEGGRQYSIAQVRRLTGLNRSAVYRAMQLGDLRFRKERRQRVIERQALLEFLAVLEARTNDRSGSDPADRLPAPTPSADATSTET
jgi:hypothetical protein